MSARSTDQTPDDTPRRPRRDGNAVVRSDRDQKKVMRRGLRHVGRAISEQRGMFTLAVLGSSLYAAMTVASAYVIGGITERVVLPSFERGSVTAGALTLAAVAILAVAVLKIIGIIGRRLFAGIMSFRLQAEYRRRVTGQYLRLPLSWHQRHPTGQLLSNANSDVEASWFFVSPLPFACGALVMVAITVVALFLTDPLLALVGLVVFPLVFVANALYSQVMSPRMAKAQQLRAEVSEIAHESFDAALVVKTLGREADETRRFGASADELRDGLVAVGGSAACSTRSWRRCPTWAPSPCCWWAPTRSRSAPRTPATWSPSPTCSPCSRCPSGPSAGCWPTCPARWPASTG